MKKTKVIFTRGLPGSGKTTWTKEFLNSNPNWKRLNKDDLRSMIDDGRWSPEKEKVILKIRDNMALNLASIGFNLIIDDTNLTDTHINRIKGIFDLNKLSYEIEIKDFTHVPLDECITNDARRINRVGEKVIRRMYNQFLRKEILPVENRPDLPNAVISDLDGTLALFGKSNPYRRDFLQDKPNEPIVSLFSNYGISFHPGIPNAKKIILSGRNEEFRKQTIEWLSRNWIDYDFLYMRPINDNRKDVILKKELYEQYIKDKYNILAIIDDRLQICRLWYELGLPLLKVGDPDSDF